MSGSDWHTSKQKVYNWPSNKSDLRPHHDRLTSSRHLHAILKFISINLGPRTTTTVRPPWYTWELRPTSDWPVMFCDWLTTDLRPGPDRLELLVWLGKSLHEIKKIQEWFATDLRPCRMTYEAIERITTDLRPNEDPAASWVTRKWNWQVPWPFLMVKRGRGACRFQWRVGPSYCEYSGVTYDLLVSNIGGTYDLADQLPINREFGHFLVASQSQVPRAFGVNLALDKLSVSKI